MFESISAPASNAEVTSPKPGYRTPGSDLTARTKLSRVSLLQPESSQVNEHGRFEQFFRRHREPASGCIATAEQRGDAMSHRPDMQRDHRGWRTSLLRHQHDQLLGRRAQHSECILARLTQLAVA